MLRAAPGREVAAERPDSLPVNAYHLEQIEAIGMVRRILNASEPAAMEALRESTLQYLSYRKEVRHFLDERLKDICTTKCFHSQLSACCSREGIITFFADVVVNALNSTAEELDSLERVLKRPNIGSKCVYLGENGCRWQVKPIVCEMFLCDEAKKRAFGSEPQLRQEWDRLVELKKTFTWPDRPVLFDAVEKMFLAAGCKSSLMYLHFSPGLAKVKRKAGL